MQPYLIGGDAQAKVVNGSDVGAEQLQGNGAGDIAELLGGRHVGIDEGGWRGMKRLETADNGGGGLHGTKDRVRGARLGDIIIACISFLPFKMNGDLVSLLEKG